MNRILSQILPLFVVLFATCLVSDCQAQRTGGLFSRIGNHIRPVQDDSRFYQQQSVPSFQSGVRYDQQSFEPLHVEASRNYENWRNSDRYNFYDVSKRYPKYYGAFHSSHFSNLGVPQGDRGFRGNGIYWTPW